MSFLRRKARDESGAATIEAILWLPMFFYILALSVDVTMVFHSYSRIIRAVEDVNRGLSVGRIKTIDEGKQRIAAALSNYKGVQSDIKITNDNVIVTNVSVPVTSLAFLGAVRPMMDKNVMVTTQQYREN
ncbi:MAG TPA: TadE/TadG family type IV pilus assembly protein [Albidovulum sp.]|uniref:TadE/TadG family type IV pilus assembly protein n=1 Tax=Albidovulum sp. TaxID=1872424 RepID=UPI002C15FF86|nr:TadE/TadG family type IV pilus assembly protein [Albidovulum sp.]